MRFEFQMPVDPLIRRELAAAFKVLTENSVLGQIHNRLKEHTLEQTWGVNGVTTLLLTEYNDKKTSLLDLEELFSKLANEE